MQASTNGFRRGSQVILQDFGGFLSPFTARQSRSSSRNGTELEPIPQDPKEPTYESTDSRGNSNETDKKMKSLDRLPEKAVLH